MANVKVTEKGTKLPLLNLKGKDYLQVAHRLVWFREVHPDGIIKTQMLDHQNETAIFRAEIYVSAGPGQQPLLVSTAHKVESKAHFSDYVEKAETGSIGRALAMAGYGTQFEPEFDEGMRLADAPIDLAVKAKTDGAVASVVNTKEVNTTAAVARPSFRKKIEEKKAVDLAASSTNDDI